MTEDSAIATRAANELRAASEALLRINALLGVIQYAVSGDEIDKFSTHSLIEIAIELSGAYAERAEGRADFFSEVSHV
ncbi:hypothetical protein DIE16_31405 [Burkholderia sp. Bp9090]|uniref:hypothetical protein n=1 Tax=Burkholderia sp. Bp9090 TaxID=2184567 RepID=UPI000F5FB340|nr:hypothetical protein [Burkholderia sp. Bp9090]RQZ27481.1 hypothetical protein DIE16_31405 [Burkholderia sp. Bp9090]